MTTKRVTLGCFLSHAGISSRRGRLGMSGVMSMNGMLQCLALKSPAGSYRQVEDKTTFAPVFSSRRLKRTSKRLSTTYGNLRGLGVFLQFRTPSISKKMTFIFCTDVPESHNHGLSAPLIRGWRQLAG